MSDREQLILFGFEPERIDWALRATKNAGLQPAMDHCLENAENPVPEHAQGVPDKVEVIKDDDEDDEDDDGDNKMSTTANSLKCDDCGKVFRNEALAGYHGEKSGHSNFSQSSEVIKPLTEEEKAQKLEELRLKLAEKRKAQQAIEIEANKANERIRRKAGQETGSMKEDMKLKQALKEAAERKADKLADAKAKQAVKLQIEADKKERAEKAAIEKALRTGSSIIQPVSAAVPASVPTTTDSSSITRLNLKFPIGPPLTLSIASDSRLRDVEEQVAAFNLNFFVGSMCFTSKFPRKVFTSNDMNKTLRETGLSPSASIDVTQA